MGVLANLAGMSVALYALVVGAAWLGQRHLMYVPDATRVAPAAAGLTGVDEQVLRTPDGAQVIVWRALAKAGHPTILYLHGNAGNLAGRADRFQRYQRQGFGLMMLSWRGYSGSSGHPTEVNNVADAGLVYDALVASGVRAEDIVVYGESLGSGVAIQLAGSRRVGALVLDAPYTSIIDVALLSYPYLPVRPLLIDRYESDRHIAKVTAPVLILHGERDAIIPVRMGRALYDLVQGEKKLALFPDGGHVDLDSYGAVELVTRWIGHVLGKGAARTVGRSDTSSPPPR
ncbi:MAG: alpha/beta hydrolase [Hyphomicrobiaceae bacterium]